MKYPNGVPVFQVTDKHFWSAWHGDILVAVGEPGRTYIRCLGPWSGPVPWRGLRPLNKDARTMPGYCICEKRIILGVLRTVLASIFRKSK